MDWVEYLNIARELATVDKAAYHRSAISRAYYAAFGVTRQWLEEFQHKKFDQEKSIHTQVWAAIAHDSPDVPLGKGSKRLRSRISQTGKRLKRKRAQADYESKTIPQLSQEVAQSLSNAETVLKYIDDLRKRAANDEQ